LRLLETAFLKGNDAEQMSRIKVVWDLRDYRFISFDSLGHSTGLV
jgi:hypothetical protein